MEVNLFTPTYHRKELTIKCLDSLIEVIKNSKHNINLFIGDNDSGDDLRDYLTKIDNENFFIKLYLLDKNIGKPRIINKMYSENKKCDYIISMDSDMISVQDYWIDEIIDCLENNKEMGVLSTNQVGYNCHELHRLPAEKKYKEHLMKYTKYSGVAGGCVIIRKNDWDMIGGQYSVFGVYGGDDAILMQSVYKKLNKHCGVVMTIKMEHPYDEDKGYKEWKEKNIGFHNKNDKGYYD